MSKWWTEGLVVAYSYREELVISKDGTLVLVLLESRADSRVRDAQKKETYSKIKALNPEMKSATYWDKFSKTLKPGMKADDFKNLIHEFLMKNNRLYRLNWEKFNTFSGEYSVKGFIIRTAVSIERAPETVKDAFDFVKVECIIKQKWPEDRYEYMQQNQKEILNYILKAIADDKKFAKYNVSTNYLKVDKMSFGNKNNTLNVIFVLKEKQKNIKHYVKIYVVFFSFLKFVDFFLILVYYMYI